MTVTTNPYRIKESTILLQRSLRVMTFHAIRNIQTVEARLMHSPQIDLLSTSEFNRVLIQHSPWNTRALICVSVIRVQPPFRRVLTEIINYYKQPSTQQARCLSIIEPAQVYQTDKQSLLSVFAVHDNR